MKRIAQNFINKSISLPKFDYTPIPYTGKPKDEILDLRKKFINPALTMYYDEPLMLVEGKMQYLFDEQGKRYLDMFAGIVSVSVGHCHPKVTKAAKDQIDTLMHTTTIYPNPNISEYAQKLISKFPEHLDTVIFTNSGSESTDLALLMARLHTGNFDFISLRNGYHGMSHGAMGITALKTWKYPLPQGLGMHKALTPNPYNGLFSDLPLEKQADKYAEELQNLIDFQTCGSVAGFIAEPIQGVGGAIIYPDGYLKKAYEIVRANGGVCIADEVQTGFGRLGTHFWGFEEQGVMPDIVSMAKGIGNGHPMGAVVTTKEIASSLTQRLFFNTFGGNPVSMAIGKAVLETIEEDETQKNSLERGKELKDGFEKLKEKYDLIGDVRVKGLMAGLELVKDRDTKAPASEETVKIFNMAKEEGLLLGKGGIAGNVFRVKPPMCVTSEDIQFAIDVLDHCFSKL